MATVQKFANLTINLVSNPAMATKFTVPMLLVDTDDVPIDKRFRKVTPATLSTRLTAASEAALWYEKFWEQNNRLDEGYVGRWVSSDSSPHVIFAVHNTDIDDWTGIADGALTLTDGAASDILTTLNCSAVEDTADICAVIEAALQGISLPNITGLDSATCTVDAYNRIVITNSTTGSAAATITATTTGSGTDLTGPTYLGASFAQAGLDAESLGAAATAVFALDNTPSCLFERGADTSQQVAFATAMNALEKFVILTDDDVNAENSESATTTGYQIKALNLKNTFLPYSRHDDYSDAALAGEVFPKDEGTISFALTPLNGVSESGLAIDNVTVEPISDAADEALIGFGYDYLCKPISAVHFTHGLCTNGDEARIVLNQLFTQQNVSLEVYQYLVENEVVTFSDRDINAIKGIIIKWLNLSVQRRCIQAGYELDMPSAASFTAAQKATHAMDLLDLTDASVDVAVNAINITLTWSVQGA